MGDFFEAVFTGFVGGAAYVLSGGNPVVAGMVAGAVSGALTGGNVESVIQGAALGGVLGGVGGAVYAAWGANGVYAMMGAGAVAATSTGGLDGLAYYAGGIMGGIAGSVTASNLTTPSLRSGHAIKDDPLHADGKMLKATDSKGAEINSWNMSTGAPGSTPADQWVPGYGPIPGGNYIVDPQNIQRWSYLPWYQKIAAYIPGRHGEWSGGTPAWGHYRVPIQTPNGTYFVTNGGIIRGNFFIHGGWTPGSAGCIDIGSGDVSFFNYLSGQNGSVPLTVNYGP